MPDRTRRSQFKNKKNEKKRKTIKVLIITASALLVLLAGSLAYVYLRMGAMNQQVDYSAVTLPPESEEPIASGIPDTDIADIDVIQNIGTQTKAPEAIYSNPKTTNILLLGLDTRDPKQFSGGRTDTIMILSLDEANKAIKLTSIMRDTLVKVPGHDLNRINTVFGYCGPEVAMDTVSQYYGIQIDYYAVVNFWAMANIIDAIGGVEISINASELEQLNLALDEINKYATDKKAAYVKHSGAQKLNGKQAVSYMRIRHTGEADFERTERQRRVLEAIANSDISLIDALAIVDKLPENVRTNAKQLDLANLAKIAYGLKGNPIRQLRLPYDGSYKMSRYKGMSILIVDFDKNAVKLKEFLESK